MTSILMLLTPFPDWVGSLPRAGVRLKFSNVHRDPWSMYRRPAMCFKYYFDVNLDYLLCQRSEL